MGTEFLLAIISSMLISNVVLSRFLGICPFLGVSKKVSSAIGMGLAVTFVLVLSSIIVFPISSLILEPAGLEFLQTIVYILIIASLVQIVELLIKRYSVTLYKSLGVYLPLIATNCAILGTILLNSSSSYSFSLTMANAIGTGLGFLLIMFIFSTIRTRLEAADVPKAFKGVPIALIATAIMALAFMGFTGMI